MYENALEILSIIKDNNYDAYIVGGYPRDKYLGIHSNDIDICTNMDLSLLNNLFNVEKDNSNFGNVVIKYKDFLYEITRFRKDIYTNSRYPKIEYVSSLEEDLKRRDFIINTLCIDYKGNYVDLLSARDDIDNRVINTVKSADTSFKEDPLRMLRALRFALNYDMKLSTEIVESIEKNKNLLNNISKNSKKRELSKIKKSLNLSKKGFELSLLYNINGIKEINKKQNKRC